MKLATFDNLGLKLFSVVVGFSLWYIVAGGEGTEMVVPVSLEFRNVPEGMEVLEESVQQVDIRLRGSSEILRRVSSQDIQARVDLSGAQLGEQGFFLNPENVAVPFGVRVLRVTPSTVILKLDRTERQNVQVVTRVVGSPPADFELANIYLNPVEIEVIGPASRLEGLEQVTTEPVSVEGLREPYTQTVQVMLEDPYVRPTSARGVEVTLEVREEQTGKRLSDVKLTSFPTAVKTELTPPAVRVRIEGPKSLIEVVTSEDLTARIDIEDLEPGTHRLVPEISFNRPELSAIAVVSIEPEQVRVQIFPAEQQ
jgi:YbbR domain-containing protein